MKKLAIDPDDTSIIKFGSMCQWVITNTRQEKKQQKIEKKANQDTVRKLLHQQNILLESNFIIVQADRTLPNMPKKTLVVSSRLKEEVTISKEKAPEKASSSETTDTKINALTKQIESLALSMTALQQDQITLKQP